MAWSLKYWERPTNAEICRSSQDLRLLNIIRVQQKKDEVWNISKRVTEIINHEIPFIKRKRRQGYVSFAYLSIYLGYKGQLNSEILDLGTLNYWCQGCKCINRAEVEVVIREWNVSANDSSS